MPIVVCEHDPNEENSCQTHVLCAFLLLLRMKIVLDAECAAVRAFMRYSTRKKPHKASGYKCRSFGTELFISSRLALFR